MLTIAMLLLLLTLLIFIPIKITLMIIKFVKKKHQEEEISDIMEKKTVKQREKVNSSTVILIIGIIFVVLSGIAFAIAGWVHTSPLGRVGIILTASAISFAASMVCRRSFRLENTSAALYSLGAVFTGTALITAGYFELFGNWFSLFGKGAALLCSASFLTVTLFMPAAYKLLRKEAFIYLGTFSAAFSIIFLTLQVTYDYSGFAVLLTIIQALITAAVFNLSSVKNTSFKNSVKILSVIYAALSFVHVLETCFEPKTETYFIIFAVLAQLILYGIIKKKKVLLSLQSLVSMFACFVISCGIEESYNEATAVLSISFLLLFVYAANRFIKPVRTGFSEFVTLIGAFSAAWLSLSEMSYETLILSLAVPTAVSILISLYIFGKSKPVQAMAGIISPIIPLATADAIISCITHYSSKLSYAEVRHIVLGALVIIFSGVSAAVIYLPKYAFKFHASHPLKTNVFLYVNMIASAVLLFISTEFSAFFLIPLFAVAVHFFVSDKLPCNIVGAASLTAFIYMVESACEYISDTAETALMFTLFIILMILSRIFFKKSVVIRRENSTRFDVILLSAWAAVFNIFIIGNLSDFNVPVFLGLIALAVYAACFIKSDTSENAASLILSASALITAFAFFKRPFFVPESEIISSKITLSIIFLTGLAYKYIWRKNSYISEKVSTSIFMLSFAGLIIDAMKFHTSSNTIFVMAVIIIVLLISFSFRSKKWFSASSAALLTMTVYATRSYLLSFNWWVYLFIAGIVLIAASAVNEYCKSRGVTIKTAVAGFFSDWN